MQKQYESEFAIYKKVLTQERNSKEKIYSLHEPQVACIAKGKAHNAYEFGTKVAVVSGLKTGVITSMNNPEAELSGYRATQNLNSTDFYETSCNYFLFHLGFEYISKLPFH